MQRDIKYTARFAARVEPLGELDRLLQLGADHHVHARIVDRLLVRNVLFVLNSSAI